MKILVLGPGTSQATIEAGCASRVRMRSGLAVSADGGQWALINASPEVSEQLSRRPELQRRDEGAGLRAVVLTSAEIDDVAGLLSLRDGPPLNVYATPTVFEDLTTGLPLLSVLQHYCGVRWHLIGVAGDERVFRFAIDGLDPLVFEAVGMPGSAPRYSERRHDPAAGDQIALRVLDPRTDQQLIYAPGFAHFGPNELQWLDDADCLLVDGSTWPAPAPQCPPVADLLMRLRAPRKVLLHVDSRHPLLDNGSAERQVLEAAGVELGMDGMEIEL